MKLLASFAVVCIFALASPSAFAQIYSPLSAGSSLVCGYMPNGKNKLFEKHGKHYTAISAKDASKAAAKRRSGLTTRLQNLREIQRTLSNASDSTVLTPKQAKELVSIAKFLIKGQKPDLGSTRSDQLANLQTLIDGYEAEQESVQFEIDAIAECSRGDRAIYGEVLTTFVYFASAARTLVLVPDDITKNLYPKRQRKQYRPPSLQQWCMDVKGPGGYLGKHVVIVSQDPCAVDQYNGASVGTLSCPQLVPAGKMGGFTGPLYGFQGGATQDAINNALDSLRSQTPATYRGRLRAPTAESQWEIDLDDCSDI